jgi:hypothetical protein
LQNAHLRRKSADDAADSDDGQRRWRFGSNNNSNSHSIFITIIIIIIIISIITISRSSGRRRSNRRLRGRLVNFARACRALLGSESGVASAGRLARRSAEAI